METYTEKMGNNPFNWFDKLNSKKINWDELKHKANSWVTCACGNLCDVIPRDEMGVPDDFELVSLGIDFSYEVERQDSVSALNVLNKIEKRSAELIYKLT